VFLLLSVDTQNSESTIRDKRLCFHERERERENLNKKISEGVMIQTRIGYDPDTKTIKQVI
jgi:hypothetical protein